MGRESTLVVMLCMHRCGSSLTTRLFQRLGMSLGPFDLGETNESNRYGHFEAQPFVLLNREIQLQQFGFEGDLPDDPEVLDRYCRTGGCWPSDTAITDDRLARGRDAVTRLMESGEVCGFKDPRTVLVWPFWERVFAGMPRLRVVPLLLVRSPHEIAMSIFRRSQGARGYDQALDATAVHFRRMNEVRDRWPGATAVVRFDPAVYAAEVRRAAEVCGLAWSDSALAETYDGSCRNHEAAVIDHPAQAAYESLAGLPPTACGADDLRRLLDDAAAREATLRLRHDPLVDECRALAQQLAAARGEIAALKPVADLAVRLDARLAETKYELALIRNSRTWRLRDALVGAFGLGSRTRHDPATASDPQPEGQDAPPPATGGHYCERKDHAGV